MGPPPTGMRPATAYSRLRRPTERSTLKVAALPSPDTTSAASAPMTSSALVTIVSSTSSRSREDASECPMASIACRNTSRRRRSVMSARTASAPRTRPAALRHGTQCTSSQRGRSSAGRAWRTANGAGAPPASASRSRAPIAGSPSTGTASSTFRPTALARATPVTRSITAFQAWMVRPGSTTTTASARPSRRLRVVASTRGVSFVTLPYAIGPTGPMQ